MKSSADIFKNSLDKAFSTIKLNSSTMGDHMRYKQGFTEEKLKGGLADGMTLGDIATKHKIDVEDDNRKFEHDNYYNSCCLRCDKRALQFIVQAIFSAIVIIF